MKYLETIVLLIFYVFILILWVLAITSLVLALRYNNDMMLLLSIFYAFWSLTWTVLAVFITLLKKHL